MQSNYDQAHQRLLVLLKKLRTNPELLRDYTEQILGFIEDGLVSIVEGHPDGHPERYIPHRPVIREGSATTKTRIVGDASARDGKGPSLNDCLEAGANLYPELYAVLLRFRQHPITFTGDIVKAFLQIEIAEEDRNVVRFLWIKNPTDPHTDIVVLRWNRVAFGLTCSPFLLGATIKHHIRSLSGVSEEVVKKLERNLYANGVLTSARDIPEARKFISETVRIFSSHKMNMRKWITNDAEWRDWIKLEFPAGKPVLAERTPIIDLGPSKVLGVNWGPDQNVLIFDPQPIIQIAREVGKRPTKRQLLSIPVNIFDPLGLIGPVVVQFNIMFHELWRIKTGWNDQVPVFIAERWCKTMAYLRELTHPKIPRCYEDGIAAVAYELHLFCDASQSGFSVVAYVRKVLFQRH